MNTLKIEPNKTFNVPLSWLIEDNCILYKRKNQENDSMELLFYEISSCLLSNKDETNIPFKSQYFNYKNENESSINFALDLNAFKCKPLHMKVPLQYLVSINPPICYKNLLFSDISLCSSTEEKVMKLKPEEYNYLYDYIYDNDNPNSKDKVDAKMYFWTFQKDSSLQLETKNTFLYNFTHNLRFHSKEFLEGKTSFTYDLNSVNVAFEVNDFDVRSNEYDNFKLRDMVFNSSLSKKVIIYSPYMVINKTGLSLIVGNGKKRNDLEVKEYNSEYFNPEGCKKILIKTDNYAWSKEFDITTLGVSGMLSLQNTKGSSISSSYLKEFNSGELDLGVRISQLSRTFYKTVAITFTPRYIISNSSSQPIVLMNHHKNSKEQILVNSGREKVRVCIIHSHISSKTRRKKIT
jgi:hypothetical protein